MSTTTSSMSSSKDGTTSSSMGQTSSSSSVQLGGRGYHHKRGCKCRLCKRGGRKHRKGGDDTPDIEMGPMEEETMVDLEVGGPMTETPQVEDIDYSKLEEGTMTKYSPDAEEKVGGTRRRKHRKSRKSRKSKKRRGSRRSSRSRRH